MRNVLKVIRICLLSLLGLVLLCALVFGALYFTRFQTIGTIEKVTDHEDGYDLYKMTVKYDYRTQDVIDYGIRDTQDYVDAVLKEALPLLPVRMEIPSYGCSVFRSVTDGNGYLMGRNYDFKLDTSCMLVRCEPKDGYRSIAFAALNNVGADAADSGLKAKLACLTAPFICLDGINEKGVSIAVLTLDSEPTDQNTGRQKITSSLAIRLVLDHAATTQEAVDLLREYDMLAVNGRDYHFFISDASGDSRAVEYDCDDEARTMIDTPIQAVTNFYARYIDRVESHQRNGIYGHGKERYDAIMDVIDRNGGIINVEHGWEALRAAATEPNPESVTSNTQWSILFRNTDLQADIVIRRHWDEVFSFRIDHP